MFFVAFKTPQVLRSANTSFNLTLHSWLANTDPRDVARVESKTVIITDKKEDTIPTPKEGVTGTLGHWMSPEDLDVELGKRFPGSMKGESLILWLFFPKSVCLCCFRDVKKILTNIMLNFLA